MDLALQEQAPGDPQQNISGQESYSGAVREPRHSTAFHEAAVLQNQQAEPTGNDKKPFPVQAKRDESESVAEPRHAKAWQTEFAQPAAKGPAASSSEPNHAPVPGAWTPDADNRTKSGRGGDSGLGIPYAEVKAVRTLSREETAAHERFARRLAKKHASEMLTVLEANDGWTIPRGLRNTLSGLLLLIASFLGVVTITQTVQFFASVQSLPPVVMWLVTALFVIFASCIAVLIALLVGRFFILQRSPRINPEVLKELSCRKKMQQAARKNQETARQLLTDYLRHYPLTPTQRARCLACGMKIEQWENLCTGIGRLLSSKYPLSTANWCDDFRLCFQSLLDKTATRRVKQYARRAAAGTAISPFSVIDRLVLLYACIAMLRDLMTIYHLRPSGNATMLVAAKAIILIYIGGMLEKGTEFAADNIADTLSDMTGVSLGSVAGALGRTVSAKTAEAALNNFFMKRLGKKTIQLLQPVRE